MKTEPQESTAVEIPVEKLSSRALDALIEAFILREGTDYGRNEVQLEVKKKQVLDQILKKEVLVLFDTESESANLVSSRDFRNRDL